MQAKFKTNKCYFILSFSLVYFSLVPYSKAKLNSRQASYFIYTHIYFSYFIYTHIYLHIYTFLSIYAKLVPKLLPISYIHTYTFLSIYAMKFKTSTLNSRQKKLFRTYRIYSSPYIGDEVEDRPPIAAARQAVS